MAAILKGLWGGAKAIGGTTLAGGPIGRAALGGAVGGIAGAIQTADLENPNLRAEGIFKGIALGAGLGFGLGAFQSGNRFLGEWGRARAARGLSAEGIKKLGGPFRHSPLGQVFSKGPGTVRDMMGGAWRTNREMGYRAARAAGGTEPTVSAAMAASPLARGIGAAAQVPIKAATFAINHPLISAGIVGGAYLGGQAAFGGSAYESPTMAGNVRMRPRYEREAMAAETARENWMIPMGSLGTAPQMMGPMQRAMQQSTEGLTLGLHRSRH